MSSKFKRLAGIHFATVSGNFEKPSYQVTVTHAYGFEYHNVVSLNFKQRAKLEKIAALVKKELKKEKLTKRDLSVLVVMLDLESGQ